MKTRTRPVVLAFAAAAFLTLGSAAPAFADDNYNPPNQIPKTAQCGSGAASGGFGAFGALYNFGVPGESWVDTLGANASGPNDLGANGYLTGLNNSGVCGDR